MPRWVRRFLHSRTIKQHLFIASLLGFAFRVLCAFFVYGPQALDDYKHGVWPAYQFFAGLPLDLPEYRSHLLVWLLAAFIKVGSWVGVDSALAQVRTMYLGLAVLSMGSIVGTYYFVRQFRSKLFAGSALYLVALFPLMPFISTRAFGEAVAMSFVLLGFGILEDARRRSAQSLLAWILGFTFLGVATLFRFQVGLLFVSYGLVLLFTRCWRGVWGAALGGILNLLAQFAIDRMSGKAAFGTLLNYLAENEGGAAQYGVSPWYNTWAFVLALSLAPFSFVLVKKIPGLWRKHWPWLVPFLLYVIVHSLIPHKEERFLYPIVGLELWAIAWLWAAAALVPAVRRVYSGILLILGVPLLFIFCVVNTQEGEIEPPAYAQSRFGNVIYLDNESLFGLSRVRFYFLREPSVLEAVAKEDFNARKIDEVLEAYPQARAVALLTSLPESRDELRALEGERTENAQCQSMRSAGSIIDRLIYALNPKHNERRRPTWYLLCARG